MQRLSSGLKLTLVSVLAALFLALPGCKRAPEQIEQEPATQPSEDQLQVEALQLPQMNPEIGITLNATPPGLVATLNTQVWIEVTDANTPDVLYSFVASSTDSPGVAPATVKEFETWVRNSPQGKITGKGSTETVFGSAAWVSGSYMDDDGVMDDIRIFSPHPSGTGTLVLFSVCPIGTKSADHRLVVMRELLANIS